ncbi:5'/3'-nucleotidase SurE [Flavobacteriales bacterium]|jgi:5'-nucleotidase|nr:5'/3'-nucleotidase SurE [Flavobacteriales bacterium]
MDTKRPLILVVNDDGVTAPGIRTLIRLMKTLGEVVVVAPDSPQSGKGHAITLDSMLQAERVYIDEGEQVEYACSGTPVDCVKLALNKLVPRKPDLCVSGINHGSNASINVLYSGTMAAALEGAIEGIPSIGFSLLDYAQDADFSQCEDYVLKIAEQVLANPIPKGACLNVNIPKVKKDAIKGIRVCRQAHGNWNEEFDERINPLGKTYYWLTGNYVNNDPKTDTDIWALDNNYISVVPVMFDLTSHDTIQELKSLNHG